VSQAVDLLSKNGDRAKVLAGGQSLIPLLKLRLASPEILVDIGRIPGLAAIHEGAGGLRIGALARHRDIEHSSIIRERYPLLGDVPRVLGDPEVRNLGTVGGSLAHADPAGDWGTALLAFDAQLVAQGPKGKRTIPVDAFFEDTFSTALSPAEVLTEIRIPKAGPRSGGAYKKLKRKTGDFAIVSAGAQVTLDAAGAISAVRIALGAVGATPMRAKRAEAALLGKKPGNAAFEEAGRLAAQESHPSSDLHGSESYKRAMVQVFTKRALQTAVERAEG
jgi:aerobic carbon-monoxide dehydrogenase medium subunit